MHTKNYQYNFRSCRSKTLCIEHGLGYKTLERWISEEKAIGKTIPGRIKLPGVNSYIWDPIIFHDQFLVAKLNGPTRNEYEKREHLLIFKNLKENRERKAV